jgi:hypothetical protein
MAYWCYRPPTGRIPELPVTAPLRSLGLAAITAISLLLSAATPVAYYSHTDTAVANRTLQAASDRNWSAQPIGDLVGTVGRHFLGWPYQAKTLELPGPERLVVDLSGVDCTTFVETSLAMARTIKLGQFSFDGFLRELQTIRYRDGRIAGYPSRLHYFSDWLYDNTRKGVVTEITDTLGGEAQALSLSFMTQHPQAYMQMQDPGNVTAMRAFEAAISGRPHFQLPKERIAQAESRIESGDVIALVTTVPGLDIAHVGLAVRENDGRIHFLNAPMVGAQVEISREPLADLLKDRKGYSGIRVARPMAPIPVPPAATPSAKAPSN